MLSVNPYRIRKVKAYDTVSYQVGRYVTRGNPGYRRSYFEVAVHLGEYETVEDALEAWSSKIDHLRRIGRENQADKLADKLARLRRLVES